MMTTVRLAGPLGAAFGKEWQLDLDRPSPGDNTPGFHVFVGDTDIGEDDLEVGCGGRPITIMPALVGAGGEMPAGGWQVIAGIALTAVGVVAALIPGTQALGMPLIQLGISLTLGGVAQLLTRTPDATPSSELEGDQTPNYQFNGPINTIAQGNPVPICYGELEVGSQVISAGIVTEWGKAGGGFGSGDTTPTGPGGNLPTEPGGMCPVPETPIRLADGQDIRADAVRAGMLVWTQHEGTMEWGAFRVEAATIHEDQPLRTILLRDGRSLTATPNHKVFVERRGWVQIQALLKGDVIMGLRPGTVALSHECKHRGPVVRISVPGARTYLTDGMLSHNIKKTGNY